MKISVEIEDILPECVDDCIDQIKNLILDYLESEQPDVCPELSDLDYHGAVHEIVDSCVPIYTKQIDNVWYLHKQALIQAYEDAGVGNNPLDSHGMAAIYFYLQSEVYRWYCDNADDLYQDWVSQKIKV